MPTAASQWKKKSNIAEELPLPSGNTALVRRPGMEAFVKAGIIPNSLLGIMMEQLEKGGAQQPFNPKDITADLQQNPDKLSDLMDLLDGVLVYCVVEPDVHSTKWEQRDVVPTPEDDGSGQLPDPGVGKCYQEEVGLPIKFSRRDPNTLYVDNVDMEDKMFIFNYAVGGTRDLERFREGSAAMLAPGQPVQAVGDDSLGDAGA